MTERDPRIEPFAGDVVSWIGEPHVRVLLRPNGDVVIATATKPGNRSGRLRTMVYSIDEWRAVATDAKIGEDTE